MSEDFLSPEERARERPEVRHDSRIVRLAELILQLHNAGERERASRNIFNHLTKEFPNEVLPILHRVAEWDIAGWGRYFYARAALDKKQPKLAQRVLFPFVNGTAVPDSMLLLAARVSARMREVDTARSLLSRISPSAKTAQGIEEVKKLIAQVGDEHSNI